MSSAPFRVSKDEQRLRYMSAPADELNPAVGFRGKAGGAGSVAPGTILAEPWLFSWERQHLEVRADGEGAERG